MSSGLRSLKFSRHVRTNSSEVFLIWNGKVRVGQLSLHHDKSLHCDLIIELKVTQDEYVLLVEEVYAFIGNVSEADTMLTTWIGEEKDFYSGVVDYDYEPPLRRDLDKIGKQIQMFTGKHNRIRGQLTESIVKEYFEKLQFRVRKGTSADDERKVDLIAENENSLILIQSKAGNINKVVMKKCIANVEFYQNNTEKSLIFAFVAKSFPSDIEFLRLEMERASSCKILCINELAIAQTLPQYRHSLS